MSYFKDTVSGVSWVGAYRGITRLAAFAKIAILARIFVPEQFGLFGIATLFLAFLEIFTETGVNVFLIQVKEKIGKYIDTAWVVSIARGAIISSIILLATPFIVSFFNSPGARTLLYLISLVPFIRGFINPSVVKFQKELQFKREFWFRSTIFLFDATVAVVLGVITGSVSSIIFGLIAGAFLEVLMSFVFVKPIPSFSFESKLIKKIISRGKWVTGAGVFQYVFRQGDDIVVGRFLGESPLGLYQVAYKISTLPISEVSDVVSRVTFPIYTKMAGNLERLKKAFFKTTLAVSVLVIPFGLIIFLFPRQIILLILGANWLEAVAVLKVLAIFGVIRAVSNSVFALLLAVEKQEYITAITFVSILGLGASIIPLVRNYGIVGAAIATIVGSVVAIPFVIYYLFRVFRQKN